MLCLAVRLPLARLQARTPYGPAPALAELQRWRFCAPRLVRVCRVVLIRATCALHEAPSTLSSTLVTVISGGRDCAAEVGARQTCASALEAIPGQEWRSVV